MNIRHYAADRCFIDDILCQAPSTVYKELMLEIDFRESKPRNSNVMFITLTVLSRKKNKYQ